MLRAGVGADPRRPQSAKAEQLVGEANARWADGDARGTLAVLEKVLYFDRTRPEALLLMADVHAALGDFASEQ